MVGEQAKNLTMVANNNDGDSTGLSSSDIAQFVRLRDELEIAWTDNVDENDAIQERVKDIETTYNQLIDGSDCDQKIDDENVSNILLSEEQHYLRMIKPSMVAILNDKFTFYEKLKSVKTNEEMKNYLIEKRKFETTVMNTLRGINFNCNNNKNNNNNTNNNKNNTIPNSSNYKSKRKIVAQWNWQQVSKWTQKMNEFSLMAGVFAEFRINGMELSIITSKQMDILSCMSHYCRNMGETPRQIVLDKLRMKINQHRVGSILKILYQQIWHRTIQNVDPLSTIATKQKIKITTKSIGWGKNPSETDLVDVMMKNVQKQQQNNIIISPVVGSNNNSNNSINNSINNGITNNNNNNNTALSHQSKSRMTFAKQKEMATFCVEIISKFRSDRKKGMLKFWKEDAVFFDKIDNILAILIMPKTFGNVIMHYFPDYFLDCGENNQWKLEEEEDDGDDEKYQNSKTSKYDLRYLTSIWDKMNITLKREEYTYNYQKFSNCVTGAEIVSFIEQLTVFRTRQECSEIADIMLNKGWIQECCDSSIVSTTLKNNKNKNNMVNHFKDRGTAFYQLCTENVNDAGQIKIPASLARFKSSYALDRGLLDSFHIFCTPVLLLGFGIVLGCVLLLVWWFTHSRWAVTYAMELTVESIEETTNLQIEIAFGIPQTILQFTIGYLLTGDIPTNESMADEKYTSLFTKFDKYDPHDAVYGIYIYNVDDDIIVGGVRTFVNGSNGTTITAAQFDDSYVPTSRPWFNETATKLGNNSRIWTDLYYFYTTGTRGTSLVSNVYVDGKWFVVFLDYTTNGLEKLISNIEIPSRIDGVLYVTTDGAYDYNVIISQDNDDSLPSKLKEKIKEKLESDSNYSNYSSYSNETFQSTYTNESFQLKWSNNLATVSPFPMVWNSERDQIGYIVIAYSDAYLDSLYNGLWWAIGISVVFCILAGIFAVLVTKAISKSMSSIDAIDNSNNGNSPKNGKNNRTVRERCGSIIKRIQILAIKCLGRPQYSIKYLIIVCEICLCFTMAIIYIMSYSTTDHSFASLIDDIMVKEEHHQVQNKIMYFLTDNVDLFFGIMNSRMQRYDMVRSYDDSGDLNYNTFFKNTMEALTDANLHYQQYAMYFSKPNGEFHGMFGERIATW